jgi:hypothetical protein
MKVHGALAAIDMALLRSFSSRFMVAVHVRNRKRLSMNCGLVGGPGKCVNGGVANGPFPLTPALSLGEREKTAG